MSGPTRKKLGDGDGGARWVDDPKEVEIRQQAETMAAQIQAKTGLQEKPQVVTIIGKILREYLRRVDEIGGLADYNPAKKRHDDLLAELPQFMDRIAAVIEDGNTSPSLPLAFNMLAHSYIDMKSANVDYFQPSKEKATDWAICALLHLANVEGLNGEALILASGLIDYKTEDSFRKRIERAQKRVAS
jgi:hypothetical protein